MRLRITDQLGASFKGDIIGPEIYVNMLNFDEMDRVVEAYGGPGKYARLGRVKAQYDPENLFRMNYNVTPVSGDPA
jgi:FAD/FMN-containing dehydrogenase